VSELTEPKPMKSSVLGQISFWLAVSPWCYFVVSVLRLPGFG